MERMIDGTFRDDELTTARRRKIIMTITRYSCEITLLEEIVLSKMFVDMPRVHLRTIGHSNGNWNYTIDDYHEHSPVVCRGNENLTDDSCLFFSQCHHHVYSNLGRRNRIFRLNFHRNCHHPHQHSQNKSEARPKRNETKSRAIGLSCHPNRGKTLRSSIVQGKTM